MVKDAIETYPLVPFLALRFGLAALALVPFVRRIPLKTWRHGASLGTLLATGYLLQTVGLARTRASADPFPPLRALGAALLLRRLSS